MSKLLVELKAYYKEIRPDVGKILGLTGLLLVVELLGFLVRGYPDIVMLIVIMFSSITLSTYYWRKSRNLRLVQLLPELMRSYPIFSHLFILITAVVILIVAWPFLRVLL